MKLTLVVDKYFDGNTEFSGRVPRDLEVGDQYEKYDFEGNLVTEEIVEKKTDIYGTLSIITKGV